MAARKPKFATAKALIRDLIVKRKTDDQIIVAVKKVFPDSAVNPKHCSKYRRELFQEEEVTAELAPFRSRDHQEWGKENLAKAKRGPHAAQWKEWEKQQKAKKAA